MAAVDQHEQSSSNRADDGKLLADTDQVLDHHPGVEFVVVQRDLGNRLRNVGNNHHRTMREPRPAGKLPGASASTTSSTARSPIAQTVTLVHFLATRLGRASRDAGTE